MPKSYQQKQKEQKDSVSSEKNKKQEEEINQKAKPGVKTSTVITGGLGILSAVAIGAAVYFAMGDAPNLTTSSEEGSVEENGSSLGQGRAEAPSSEQGAVDAAYAAADLLNSSYIEAETQEDLFAAMEAIEGGDLSEVDDNVMASVRFADEFERDEDLQATVVQTLVGLSFMVKDAQGIESDEEIITAISDEDIPSQVLYDEEMGIAYVPIQVMVPDIQTLTMEMVYTEEGWQLSPYSLVEAVAVFAMMEEMAAGAMPEQPGSGSPEDLDALDEEELAEMLQEQIEGSD